ncbi:MAG: DNA recombination protein RmuC [Puniceicoccales bacterium]|jgi:DNA recombination protein RmuC|nr:DNA recombination protein RmuC [Puniceicoccales bacterium]
MLAGLCYTYPKKQKLQNQNQLLQQQCKDLQGQNQELRGQNQSLQREKEELLKISGQVAALSEERQRQDEKIQEQDGKIQELLKQNVSLESYQKEEEQRGEHFKLKMAQLAQSILETKKQSFSQETQKEVGGLIQQLKRDFEHFHQAVFEPEKESRIKLSTCFEQLVKQAESMQNSTENLAKALRGDSKVQGDWGETQLENLLEEAGLREENGDYVRQGIGLQLQLDQQIAKPDFLFRLPRNQWILIDAKVSLTAYEQMTQVQNEPHDADYKNFLEQHRQSIRKHIDEIAKYHELKADISICPFLLMFIPIESAYATAITSHQQGNGESLAHYARKKNVIPVYPSTLFLTLKLIQLLWQIERQNKNTQEIAKRGGLLYDKFAALLESLKEVNKLFGKLQDQFHLKIEEKIEGKGGLLVDCKKLEELGVKCQKSLPENFYLPSEEEMKTNGSKA